MRMRKNSVFKCDTATLKLVVFAHCNGGPTKAGTDVLNLLIPRDPETSEA